jgi:DNA-directed RNA polymerase specialized sigma subunit
VSRREYQFAEVAVDRDVLERFSQNMSAYYEDEATSSKRLSYAAYKRKLIWHIRHSLSERQRQTLLLLLSGKTEREVAAVLGVTQQVVLIYKQRAIKHLHDKL